MRSRDMVMQRRGYFGFGGIHTPSMPRTWRSGGKRTTRKKAGSSPMCAFDVLAAVAGEILLKETPMPFKRNGGEPKCSFITNPARNRHHHEAKPFKIEPSDQGSCNESVVACYNHRQRFPKKFLSNDLPQALRSMVLEPSSDVKFKTTRTTSCKPATYKSSGDILNSLAASSRKLCTEKHSPGSAESYVIKLEDGVTASQQTELQKGNAGTDEPSSDLLCKENLADLDSKPPQIVSSDSSIELPSHRNFIPRSSSCPGHRDDMEIVDRDDDENSSKRTQPSNIAPKAFIKHHIVDKKIRKICASKFWKVGPTLLQGGEPSKNGAKPLFGSRKICYPRPRTQHLFSKRRILSQRNPLSICSGDIISEDVPLSADENVRKEVCNSSATLHEGNRKPSSSAKDQKAQIKSEEYQVKFSIKSVKLPELFIEMPETATVAEMKRTVLDAMIAILQNKLRVGVLLQGKKVRDDSKTLVQSGLCDGAKLDSLGFSLEPFCSKAPQIITPKQLSLKGRSDEAEAELSPRLPVPAVPASESVVIDSKSDPASPSTAATVNHAESNLNLVPHTNDSLADKTTASSKALVAVPTRSAEALSVVPLHRKSKRAELAQRRIRRPFSVSEVEALVQAVEKLGTGRWRDVKLRAFDTAKHRTYVDLKDKWKTLVHTATISPQQRRGEPVPQPLLDRVLAAHAYWSQQQAKLQIKPQQLDQCIL